MADIIQFPTWILEKERKLDTLEFELHIRKQSLEASERKIRSERRLMFTRMIVAFCIGMLVMSFITLPLI